MKIDATDEGRCHLEHRAIGAAPTKITLTFVPNFCECGTVGVRTDPHARPTPDHHHIGGSEPKLFTTQMVCHHQPGLAFWNRLSERTAIIVVYHTMEPPPCQPTLKTSRKIKNGI